MAKTRRQSRKERASSLFFLSHTLEDVKSVAQSMGDYELCLLVGMVELLVEERTADLGGMRALRAVVAAGSRPN
jgi:hypothetical protein